MASAEAYLKALQRGEICLTGHFLFGSNHTLLVDVQHQGKRFPAVYKPSRGERPLWDFPHGSLAAREVAAFRTSQALGWDLVPATVLRHEGPAGAGSLQLYVEADPEVHYFTFSQADKQRLRPVALFDTLINNADRKAGHILLAPDGHLWLIDHGVCFHTQAKLRTVVWDFAGQPIPEHLLADLERVHDGLRQGSLRPQFEPLLASAEIRALERRALRLLETERFPEPGPQRPYPWPLV